MFKKGFVGLMVFAMILTMAVTAFTGTAKAVADGAVVKVAGSSTVFYINGGKAYVFPNEKTYKTWYPDFSNVVTISSTELGTYTISGNVTYRPGTKMVKITDVATVYTVEPGGVLRSIVSEANAKALYGDNWNKMIEDVPTGFFVNYTVGSALTEGKYPTGTLVKTTGSSTTYYIDGTTKRPVATGTAFEANAFSWSNVLTASSLAGYTDGTSITAKETALVNVAGSAGSVAAGDTVTVALAANNPAAATVISDTVQTGQGLVPMLTVNFTAPASGDVIVTGLKFKRTGISADADVLDLYLYDGLARLYQGGSLSSNYATFNAPAGIFTVKAGTTKAVALKVDLNQNTSAGKTMGFELTEVTTKNSATVSGTLPIGGNLMTTASVTDMGYVNTAFGNVPTSAQTVNPGEDDFEVYKVSVQANDQDLQLEYLKLTLLGSVNVDDIQNIKLTVSGTTLVAGTIDANRELIFDLTGSPYVIAKGQTKILSVRGDVVKGSTRNFRFSVEYSSDFVIKDKNYGVYLIPIDAGTADSTWAALKSSASTYVYTINEGSLAISLDTSSPTENVASGATNVKLATWKFEATGEDVKVKTLEVIADTTTGIGLDNGKVLVSGVQVGSTTDLTEDTAISFSFGSSFIIPAATFVLVDVYADVKTTASADITSGTVKVTLDDASGNAQGQSSLTSIDAPSSDNAGTALTVSTSALTLVAYSAYGNQTMVIPSVAAKVASFVVQAGAYEGVTIDTINIDQATSGVMQNMKLMMGSTQLGDTKVTLTSTTATDNVFSVSLALAANESKVIDVYADVKSGIDANTIDVNVGAIGSSVLTGTTVYQNSSTDGTADVSMQTITLSTGSIYSTADGSKPDADIVVAGTTVAVNAIKFTAVNEAYTVTKMRIESAGSATTSDSIGEVILSYKDKAGNTVTKTGYLDSSDRVDYTGLNAYVPKDGTAVVTVKIAIPTVSSGADSGDLLRVDFNKDAGFSALGELSNTTITHSTAAASGNYLAEVEGNVLVVRKTRPTITYLTDNMTTVLGNGQKYIASFKVTADAAGSIAFKELNFSYSTTTGVDVTDSTIYLYRSTDTSTALNSAESLTKTGTNKLEVVLTSEEEIAAGSSKSYLLQGTFTGVETSDSFTLNLLASTIAADYTGTGVDVGTTTTYTYLAGWEHGGILWSDESVTGRTSASADYADCSYVKSLPTNSWTMSN